jgi:hypothetical protein
MSAVPTTVADEVGGSAAGGGGGRLSLRAGGYFFIIATGAAIAAVPLLTRLTTDMSGWATFAALGLSAAVAQLFVVRTPRNQSYHATIAFLVPAAILLPPELVALVAVVQHIPEWLKNRSAWYIQTFNICNWTLAMLAAWGTFHAIGGAFPSSDVGYALAGLGAAALHGQHAGAVAAPGPKRTPAAPAIVAPAAVQRRPLRMK